MGHCLGRLVQMLAPFAPHLAEEHWHRFGAAESVFLHPWPEPDPAGLTEDTVLLVFQVNGRLRGEQEVTVEQAGNREAMIAAARAHANVARHLEGTEVVKEIFVPGKLVNLVVR